MNKFMEEANNLAKQNNQTGDGGPFGAVVVKDGKIIGKGNNKVLIEKDPTAHAEIIAIRDACRNLNTHNLAECELYTTCYPCPMCLSAIIWSNIKVIYYGNTKEDADKIGFRDNIIYKYLENLSQNNENETMLKVINLDREETIKTFKEFENQEKKNSY